MKRFEVMAQVPKIGRVKHIIKAADEAAAIEKMKAAHPEEVATVTREMGSE